MTTEEFRKRLLECLGGPWPDPPPLHAATVAEPTHHVGYTVQAVSYEAEPDDRVPAYLLLPDGCTPRQPAAAVAVWHQHAGQYDLGKSEPAGLAGDPMHHTGAALAREGYVVLCPDALCFEERRDPTGTLEGGTFERFEFLRYTVAGKCLAWKSILDMRRAIDYLASRAEVDPERIGCYGHSMGSTQAWLLGPWEDRLRGIVCNCCLPTYAGIHREHMLHCFPNFIPGLHAFGDTPDIVSLIAPRPLHMNFGETDGGSPIADVRRALPEIADAYRRAGAEDCFTSSIEAGSGHVLSAAMWRLTKAFFSRRLT